MSFVIHMPKDLSHLSNVGMPFCNLFVPGVPNVEVRCTTCCPNPAQRQTAVLALCFIEWHSDLVCKMSQFSAYIMLTMHTPQQHLLGS